MSCNSADERKELVRSAERYPILSPFEKITSALPFFQPSQSNSSSSSSSSSSPNSLPPWLKEALQDPTTAALLSATAAAGLTLLSVKGYRRFFRRLRNADSVTGQILEKTPWVTGIVTRVGDGDGFRLYHTPGLFWRYPLKFRSVPTSTKELKDETLSIRIAGVDAPELAHFGNPAQPHARESLKWLTKTVEGKRVKVEMLRKDQYGRIVGIPYLPRLILPNKPLPIMMLREGMAVVYTAGGAEFGKWGEEGMRKVEDEARRARRGLWAAKKLELPGDFKKRMKSDSEDVRSMNLGKQMSWWERLGKWLGGKT